MAVADRLRTDIRSGRLKPGARLRQDAVAEELDVSSTPVREAFRILQAEGLVTLDPHRGVVVFQPTAKDVIECYELRALLETQAIAHAVPQMKPVDIAAFEQTLDDMDAIEDHDVWLELNSKFHSSLYQLSDRSRLCAIIESLSQVTSGYMHIVVRQARLSGRAGEEHREILAACAAGDVVAAQKAIRTHLSHTVDQTLSLLSGAEGETEVTPLRTAR